MIEGPLAYDAMVRVILKDVRQKRRRIARSERFQRHNVGNVMLPPLGKLGIVIRQSPQRRPRFRRRRAASLKDLEQLINIGSTGKQRDAGGHFRKDASHGPNIDSSRISIGAQQQLGRAIPQRNDLVRVWSIGKTR